MRKTSLSESPRKVRIKGKLFWQVTKPKLGGGRERRTFKDKADAITHIETAKIQQENYGNAAMGIDDRLRVMAVQAQQKLQPFGATLMDAAEYYAKHLARQKGGIPLTQALAEFLKSKSGAGFSAGYLKTLRHHLQRLCDTMPARTTASVTTGNVDEFLTGLGLSAQTASGFRQDARTFFEFCVGRGYCSDNPVNRAARFKPKPPKIGILTVEETARLLAECDDDLLPAVAIAAFCGLRQAEIERLDWKAVDLAEGIVTVDASIAKTASRRTVAIPDNLNAWLKPLAKASGPIVPSGFRRGFDRVRVRAGFKPSFEGREDTVLQGLLESSKKLKVKLAPWPSNCLRHGAISYRLALTRDLSRVATESGNSPAIIARHYLELVKPSDAKRYAEIKPETAVNVVDMAA